MTPEQQSNRPAVSPAVPPATPPGVPPAAPPATAPATAPARIRVWRNGVLPAILLAAAVLVVYLPAIEGGYIWDDNRYVTENPVLPQDDGLVRIWTELGATIQYYPMVFTTFWLEYRLWGLDPLGFHLTNVVLHLLSALLLWRILRRLAVPGAFLAAAFFALHPVHVESVAWITERKNVLSGFFYLAALWAWLRFAYPGEEQRRRWGAYALTLLFFALALLSKTVTSTLPAVLLLIAWWKHGRIRMREVLPTLPMFVLGAGMGLVTVYMERSSVGCVGPDWAFSTIDRILIAGRAVWFYLGKLVVPYPLIFNYERWSIDPGALWQYVYPLAVVAVIAGLWLLRRRIGRGPLAAFLFFCGTLFPALGFIDTYPMRYSFVADHFQYLASIGPLALLAAGLMTIFPRRADGQTRRAPATRRPAAATVAVGGLLVIILGALTWQQGQIYADRATVWRDTLEKNADSFIAHCNLGGLLLDAGNVEEAEEHLREAVRLKPNFHEAHASLGKALVEQERVEEGVRHYREALRVKPNMAWAHQSLGSALLKLGQDEEAIASFSYALRLQPDFFAARFNLASALAADGQLGAAVAHFQAALELAPGDPLVHANLADALSQQEKWSEAVGHYRRAIELDPDLCKAYRNLGAALMRVEQPQEAIQEYWLALRCDPRDPLSHRGMAGALVQTGRYADAVKEYERTLALDPDDEAARQALDALRSLTPKP